MVSRLRSLSKIPIRSLYLPEARASRREEQSAQDCGTTYVQAVYRPSEARKMTEVAGNPRGFRSSFWPARMGLVYSLQWFLENAANGLGDRCPKGLVGSSPTLSAGCGSDVGLRDRVSSATFANLSAIKHAAGFPVSLHRANRQPLPGAHDVRLPGGAALMTRTPEKTPRCAGPFLRYGRSQPSVKRNDVSLTKLSEVQYNICGAINLE
jgi:hypothetical protein